MTSPGSQQTEPGSINSARPPQSDAATPPAAALGLDTRITASLDVWKRKLIDISKRNRALNFRINKVSTIAITDEQPAEVFRHLYLQERTMKFRAALAEPQALQQPSVPDPNTTALQRLPRPNLDGEWDELESDEGNALALDFAPYASSALHERHTDEWLQTASSAEALDKSLRRIDEQARVSIEEQGVNVLFLALGMLHYTQAADSEQVFRAPLVLLPIELVRKSARSGYVVKAADDDPVVNPALSEYLKREHAITLRDLPDSASIPDDYDLQEFFTEVNAAIRDKSGWSLKTDICLGLFSFQKLVMYKDLEANGERAKQHRLVRQLIGRSGGQGVGLPDDVRRLNLDEEYPPESTYQVVDADSSQLRAIAAASRNHDLVIEGPPGTGKSQTITNLIAQALAVGKSVLFVAEKMAALSVVHSRLVQAGLGEFCLELHSTKANKRAVMKELSATLDASVQQIARATASTQRLPKVRTSLAEYVRAVHAPQGVLGISPYSAYGRLGSVFNAPRVRYTGPTEVTLEQLDETIRNLADLSATSAEVGLPAEHPWRDTSKTFYSEDDLASVEEAAERLTSRLGALLTRAARIRDAFALPPIGTFADIETASTIAEVLTRSPGAPLAVLDNNAWNAPPHEALDIIAQGREFEHLRSRVVKNFTHDVMEREHADDITYVERKSQGLLSFLSFLDGRFRATKKRWVSYRLASFHGSLADQAEEMRIVDRLQAHRRDIASREQIGRELFGPLWEGERSDWNALQRYIAWVVEFRGLCVRHSLSGKALELASRAQPDVSDVRSLRDASGEAQAILDELRSLVGWPEQHLAAEPIGAIAGRAQALKQNIRLGPKWASFESARRAASKSLAQEIIPRAMTGDIAFRDIAPAFLRAFYQRWLTEVVRARPALEQFHTMTHEERVAEFRQLDERVLRENRAALISELRDRAQHALRDDRDVAEALSELRPQLSRQRGLRPLRQTMNRAGKAIRTIKPCLMMSPLSVAQLLDGSQKEFDLVIFDEASQLPPEDAVGAIMRGQQLVVVGDPKQLPPTDFFSVSVGTVTVAHDEEGNPLYEDSESILEEYMGAGVPMSRLKWHYRSTHESLISFSNISFYDADLYTFPSVQTGTETSGLQFEHVPTGVYEGKGLNHVEASRVADEVVRFAREQFERRARGEAVESLGVGTFNMRQQLAIQDELEKRRRDDPSLEPFFYRDIPEPFFVKNLENIQGDERDVIFISVTYARGTDGRLRHNFGPLNGENGWRRLNVLTTRARHRMKVFSSMRGDEISAAATTARGAHLLRDFLVYAERGRLDSAIASLAADTESPLERDILLELTNRGVKVVPQVGMAGYRIDLGVLDDMLPGQFLCGIECDGVAYHSSETARDRDRLRQQVLEARGWTIHRVWSTDWFKDRQGQIERLMRLISETRASVREEIEGEREARSRVADLAARMAPIEESTTTASSSTSEKGTYVRPAVIGYVLTPGEGRFAGGELLWAPDDQVLGAVLSVVEIEGPVHEVDLFTRVAGMWTSRAGSRIRERILRVCRNAERSGQLARRGDFLWRADGRCEVRSRSGTKIPADRIAPEEYVAAVLGVLAWGRAFSRPDLTAEVRSLFGFNRTGAILDEAIGSAIDKLHSDGKIGEGSAGFCLRK